MKHINLTQMLQGCSKRNGMTVSASNPDGEPTVNRQSRLMSLSGKKAEKEQLSPSCLLSASFPLSFRSRYLRYAAMIFCVLVMSIGQAWGDTSYYLFTPTSAPNPSHTGTLSGDFVCPGATSGSKTIDTYTFTHQVNFGSALGSGKLAGSTAGNKSVDYHVKTTSTTFRVYLYNNSGSAAYNLNYAKISEGSATVSETSISVAKSFSGYKEFTVSSTTNTTVAIYFDNTNIRIMQVIATESGTAHKQACEDGYTLSFYKGRIALKSDKTITAEGLSIKCENNFTYASSESLTFKKNNPSGNYLSFTTPAGGCKIKVTWSGSGQIAYNTSAAAASATNMTSGTEYALSGSTTYYVINSSSGSGASITKLEFKAAAAKAYTVTAVTSTGTNTYGTVSAGASSLDEGETTTITAVPASGYRVTNWAVSGTGASISPSGASNSTTTTLTMGTANATVTVTFGAIPTHTITYTNTKSMDNSANPTSYYEGVGVASFTKLRHAVGYDFTGWSPSSISSSATTNQTIDAQWTARAAAAGTGTLTYALAFGSGTITTTSITRNNGALYDATDVSLEHTSFADNANKTGCSGKLTTTSAKSESNYVELTFKIADGYTFTPTEVRVQGIAVSDNKTIEVELTDNAATPNSKSVSGTLTAVSSPTTGGYTVTLDFDASGTVTLEGTVTVKIFAYGATNHWRMGTPFVITGTVASAAPSCTAPNHVDVTPTAEAGNYGWRYTIGETLKLTATPYSSEGTSSPITSGITGYQWQKYVGNEWVNLSNGGDISGATSANLVISNLTSSNGGSYRCVISTGATCSTASTGYWVRVFTLNGNYYNSAWTENPIVWSSEYVGVATVSLNASSTYMFKVYDNDGKYFGSGSGNYIIEDGDEKDCGTGNADIRLFTGPAGSYTFTVDVTNAAVSSPYVNVVTNYPSVTHPAVGYMYITKWWDCYPHWWDGSSNALTSDGNDPKITKYTTICGTDYWYMPVLDNYTNVYFKDNATWGSAGNHGEETSSTGHSGQYYTHNGVSWGWHEFTTYTISFAGNGNTGGSMSAITGICPNSNQAITANVFEKTGHTFNCWHADVATKVGGSAIAIGGDIAGGATLQEINNNITLTAQWSPEQYDVTTSLTNVTVSSGTTGTDAATYNTAYSVTFTGSTGYNLPATVTVMRGTTDITASCTWTQGTGVLSIPAAQVTGDITITVTGVLAATCTGDPTALVSGELYTIDEMVSNCSATAISSTTSDGTGIFQYGLSSNGKFYVVGTTNGDNNSTGTVEMKKQGASTITVKDETFTYIAWFKGSGSTSCRSIKFVTPSAGTLIIYGKVSSGDGKGNIELKQGSNSAVDVMPKSKNKSDTVHVNITAGATCYIWADGSSAALYGLKFVAAVPCTTDPTVTEGSKSSVGSTTATVSCASGISALGTGGCTIISYGFVIGTATDPTIGGSGVTQHEVGTSYTTTGTLFSKDLTGLTAETTYYVRPYATNGHGTAYGTETSFTTTAAPTLYTVTFESNGGSAVSPIEQASEGANITMPTPTNSGYTFQGWVIGGTTYAAGASYTPTANITAYASWKENCTGGGGGGSAITWDFTDLEAVAFTNGKSYSYTANDGETEMRYSAGSSDAIVAKVLNDDLTLKKAGYLKENGNTGGATVTDIDGKTNVGKTRLIRLFLTGTGTLNINCNGDNTGTYKVYNGSASGTLLRTFKADTACTRLTVTTSPLWIETTSKGYINTIVWTPASSRTCFYVTYNGNGAEAGSISDANAYAAGDAVTVSNNTGASAFTKSGYHVGSWNTAANGSGTTYALGATFNISANVTLYAQWVADACSAPSEPTISGTSVRTAGQTIELIAFCESGKDASTTYTWYKGDTWETKSQVQAPLTIEEGGRIFNKASCTTDDTGKYWCKASNGTGCESHNATGFTVTVNSAVATHIYYYKDADHYDSETDTYYTPEGNTAALKDNQNLSSPWTICNGCMTGVDSVVAHGATYDGKGNWVNAYIKIPKEGTATTNNIKFALSAGYTGTLTIKIGKYKDDSTVPTASLKLNGEGDAIAPTSGSVGGVATTENSLNTVVWPLNTAGGTYILTVASSNAYISQIDMTTTATAASFSVTYNGNGNTGGTVPTTTNHSASTTVTVEANSGSLVKTNYTGAGWNTANNGTGTNYVPGSGTFTITANTTLYAHWTQLITLAPGAQGTGTNNAAVSWNGSVLRGFAAHTASGYALQGYYTEPSGGTKVLNADGSFAATDIDGFVTSGKWSNTGAAPTLYAQWEASNLLKWNLKVNVSETSITTLSKESAAPTVIAVANMGNLTNNGSLTITGSAKSGLTSKIATTASAADENAGKYMSVQFVVAAGYQLVPSDIKVKVQPISHSQRTKLILEDNNSQSISYTSGSLSKGSTHTVTMTNSEEVAFTGTVTLKIYVYGTAESDGYRLGTPIEINGSVEATCATPPTFDGLSYDATEYTVGASASAIEVTGAANVTTYAWKQNDVNDRSGGEAATGTNNAVSYTPPTSATGTKYYWCEMTNTACGITIKTPAVGITVRNATTDPTVTWSNVKLNGETATPNYGGGNYVLRATVDQSAWTGTLAASMITAPAGIRIHHVTTGTDASREYIEFQFDVTTAFDRASNATIDFNLALPEAGSYSALNSVKSVTYNDCSGGAAGQVAIKMGATASTSKSNPQNYWETAGAGRLMFNYGSSMGSSYNSTGYKTADSTFNYYAASTGQKWMFQTYIAGVNKVRVAFRAAGTIKSSKATITNFYYNTEYFASPGSNAVSFGDVNANKAGYSSGEDGYIEFTVPEMAANSYGAFVTADGNMKVYGVVLYSENAGDGGSVATNPVWSDSKADGFTVEKNQSDANFGYTISTTTNTLGAITYSSSKPSCATVDAKTGEVTITATGESEQSAVITATLARSGCYQGATRTYTIKVRGLSCSEPSGSVELTSGSATKCASESVTLTMKGFTEGAFIQWYNGESTISNGGGYTITTTATQSTLTTTSAGTYSAIATSSCAAKRTNSITIANMDMSEQKTVRKVSQWYVKNGRPTPDIALWQLGEGETFKSVAWSTTNGTGLDFVTRNGIVYLEGKEPSANETGADIPYTLTLTITDACGTDHKLSGQTIMLTHQKNTDKHVLAFVVNGTAKGGFTEGITAAQTTSVGLYNAIAANFDVQATNIYSTDDEQKLREYYSQYDILCITDYPNTQTKGANSKSYVDAIGALIDIRPILTMEAFVSSLANWKAKGISGNPKSPTTRQYTMDLQCKDHEVFSGVTTTKIGEGDEAMYRVTMVDKNQEEYKTLDANYGDGEHKANEGYQYGKKPALQGFTFTEAMSENDLLPLGLIDDGAGNKLQVGIERQHEMSARLMVLGINSYAMERLIEDGEKVVINALKYLMKKNAEDISDCSVYFDGSDKTDSTSWDNELNWGPSYTSLPLYNQEVRILKPCVVKNGTVVRASGIKIIPSGRINHDTDNASGSLTIEPGGALIVDGKVRAAVAPNYFNATPTTPSDLVLQSNSSAQAALILDNSEGETQATVQMYSPSYWEVMEGTNKKKSYWSYVGVPIQDVPVGEYFYGAVTYLYDETSGWIRKRIGSEFHAFEGIGLSLPEGNKETFYGTLASTETKEITLTKTTDVGEGDNLIGNSWTAPIQIGNFDLDDFGSATAVVSMYKTGRDDIEGSPTVVTATTGNDGAVEAGQWVSIPIGLPGTDGYDGPTVIPSMQAFQVTTSSETTLTLDYDKLVRDVTIATDNLTQPMSAPKRKMKRAAKKSLDAMMRVRMSGFKTRADLWIMEDGRFSDEYDNGWEANYIECDNRSPQLYANSEIGKMAFLAKPDIEGTILGIAPSLDGNEYLFTFHYVGDEEFYLNDLKLKQSVLISEEESYSFMYEDGDTNRFYISRTRIDAPQMPTGVENTHGDAVKARKFIYNDKLYIMLNGRVYSAEGQLVK